MRVCHCQGVNDGAIADAVAAGCTDREAVAARCGAGAHCGGCQPAIDDLLDRLLDRMVARRSAA